MRHLVSRLLLIVLCFGLFVPRSEAAWSSNPRRAVVLEAFYALRQSHDGGCDRTLPWQDGSPANNCASSWNYLANNWSAYNTIKGWYGTCIASVWSGPGDGTNCGFYPLSFYNNVYVYGYSNGPLGYVGRGGQCKFFADLVLYRSGVQTPTVDWGTHTLPTYLQMWNNSDPILRNVREGDILFKFDPDSLQATPHTAIVVEIKRVGGVITGLDVIDSNFLSDSPPLKNREVIGRHLFQISNIQNIYRIWKGADYYGTEYDPNK